LPEQQIVGIEGGEVGHLREIALGNEQVEQAGVVEIGELDCQPVEGRRSPPA